MSQSKQLKEERKKAERDHIEINAFHAVDVVVALLIIISRASPNFKVLLLGFVLPLLAACKAVLVVVIVVAILEHVKQKKTGYSWRPEEKFYFVFRMDLRKTPTTKIKTTKILLKGT